MKDPKSGLYNFDDVICVTAKAVYSGCKSVNVGQMSNKYKGRVDCISWISVFACAGAHHTSAYIKACGEFFCNHSVSV